MAENDLLTRLLDAGMTFTALTQAKAEELIRDLVRAGAVQADRAQGSVDELLERSRRNSERLIDAVRTEIDDQIGRLDLATRHDVERVVQRFADVAASIVAQVAPDRAATGRVVATSTGAETAPARKTAAKKTAARKAPAKKAAAKAAPAKKAGARKTAAKKAGAKKTAAKKAGAKKTAAKKTGAKKTGAKKTAAKRSGSGPTG